MKTRSTTPKVILAIMGVILLVFISYCLIASNSSYLKTGGVKKNPEGVVFIPKKSPLMVSLLINPDKLSSLAQLLPNNGEQKRVVRAMEQLRSNLLTSARVDSPEDIKSWLGDEITLAVTSLDYDYSPENGIQPGYLLAVKNKSPELAKEFLQTYYSREIVSNEVELILEDYQGVNIVYQHPLTDDSPVKQVAAAVVADFVLFANDLPVLKDAINNAQAVDLNLAHDLDYQSAIASLPQKKVSIVYGNLPLTSAWITNQSTIANPDIYQSLTLSLALNPQGLITHTALSGVNTEKNQAPSLTSPPQTLNYIPEDSILTIAGINLTKLGENISNGITNHNPLAEIIYQGIHPLELKTELDFNEEIFSSVSGEYALSLSKNTINNSLEWLFINQKQENSLAKTLDNIAQNRGLSVGQLPLENTTMTAWTKLVTTSENNFSRLQAEVKGVHSETSNEEIITNSVNLLSKVFSTPFESLLQSSDFQESIKALPQANNGYLFIRWQDLAPYLRNRFPIIKIAELAFKPLFDNLESVTITTEGTQDGISYSTSFFHLKG
ncbi:DUF3352 domain-containing protein [Cyanobacterium aponinum UTEX 3221]|uniref:DUF3352 domain-containing protein n=1 Tax=Cyanobacterium aponinum (strain PCC 10605) TaxID=755178 RepID=K9Z8L5_CYAAP|nr:DUF3352 domain-containing protein [Cyanobacterium aponinum]AFZ54935.1 hypothetical protein Cyan10605_2869 [Cyanobacterium aponinum PCC 10605]WRL40184.1 DUF3352 domain-containing protein [Cyanobacterium aponinum UTEX 3221]